MSMDAIRLALPENLLRESRQTKLPSRLSISSKLLLCEVHDVIAYGHAYIVKGLGTPRMTAVLGAPSGAMAPIGARSAAMLVPGSLVLCWVSETSVPVILCAVAGPMGTNLAGVPDSIVACGNAGLFADPAHQHMINRPDSHGLLDFSAGRPIDNLPGDWGEINEFGMSFFLGRTLAMMRASDSCKVEMFYLDQLLRLVAYNYQQYTSGSEREAFNDEGEYTDIDGFSPYPWEAMGVMIPGEGIFTAEDSDPLSGGKFGVEPKEQSQAGFWRKRTFKGYLGDLERSVVAIPNKDLKVNTFEASKPYIGVLDEIIGVDGSYTLRSARGITLERTAWIQAPQPKMTRDDPQGDNAFSNGSGVGTTIDKFPESKSSAESAAKFYDEQAYFLNRAASQGFNLRRKDWELPETPSDDVTEEMPPLVPYTEFNAPQLDKVERQVDHRRKVDYHKGKAFITLTPDGGALIQDAFGSAIRLVDGNVEISCPGDIIFRSGRNTQVWAGRDTVIKSNKAVDISSAQSDVRVKAENNMYLLGGNSGKGGVLVENRGQGDMAYGTADSTNIGGLVLKSSRGTLGIVAHDMYFKSVSGGIVFDGNGGDADITMFARDCNKYLKSGAMEVVAPRGEMTAWQQVSVLQHSTAGYNVLVSSLDIGAPSMSLVNHLTSGGATTFKLRGTLILDGSGIASSGFNKGDVGKSEFVALVSEHKETQQSVKTDDLTYDYDRYINAKGVIGNKDLCKTIGVRFRGTDELSVADMKVYEAAWQQRFRTTLNVDSKSDYPGAVFTEKEVFPRVNPDTRQNEGDPTMPFPGYKAWTRGDAASFVRYKPEFYTLNNTGGKPLPRGNDVDKTYDVGKIKEPDAGKFDRRYPVNI